MTTCHTLIDVPTYSLRPDPELDAALEFLGATPGNRSKIMREAILAQAAQRRLAAFDDGELPTVVTEELKALRDSIDKLRSVFG